MLMMQNLQADIFLLSQMLLCCLTPAVMQQVNQNGAIVKMHIAT